MNTRSRRGGFSLIELLTVIAIIAILAAIIFPVMSAVKKKAQEGTCMSNLHQMHLALDLYKRDNRKYPPQLCAVKFKSSGTPDMFENAKGDLLYPEHVSSIKLFHCPTSKVTRTDEVAQYPSKHYDPASPVFFAYPYDSYDCYVTGVPQGLVWTNVQQQYALDWARDVAYLSDPDCPLRPDGAPAGDPAAAQNDYERQLKFRNPPGDTVLTWCMWHANDDLSGRALVLFADGSVSAYDARVFNASKWRIKEKKE